MNKHAALTTLTRLYAAFVDNPSAANYAELEGAMARYQELMKDECIRREAARRAAQMQAQKAARQG